MIDHIQGPGPGAPPPPRPEGSKGKPPKTGRPSDTSQDVAPAPEFRGRLGSVSARIEKLQQTLAEVSARGGDTAAEESALQREISAAQIAFQNILSSDASGQPEILDSVAAETVTGHHLKPGIVLQLLE